MCNSIIRNFNSLFSAVYRNKKDALIKQNDNALATKYITMLSKTITDCVIATNQTYVDSLKAQGKFDAKLRKRHLT